jgi:hypothetical protein
MVSASFMANEDIASCIKERRKWIAERVSAVGFELAQAQANVREIRKRKVALVERLAKFDAALPEPPK